MLGTIETSLIDKHIGARVRALRHQRGLSQSSLGHKIGVAFQQIQKYEVGLNRIPASRLYLISLALDISVTTFFEGLPPTQRTA